MAENITVDRRLSVIQLTSGGRELILGIMEHCLEKKKLKSSTFFVKSVMKRFPQNSGGIIGIFLLLKKIFDRDHYTLEFFCVFISLFTVL